MVEPVKRPVSMISFGDSITHGYDCSNPSFSYASRLADAFCAEAVNKGIGGEMFYPTLASLKDDLDPDIITVAYGTNDWSHSTKVAFDRDAKAFYEILSKNYPKAKIFAITPLWRHNMDSTEKDVGPFSYVHDYLAKVTAELPNVTLINGLELVPHEWRCFPGDGLHPNDEGFRHYANNLYAAIKKYL
jgi:lysophospholipase L1-like esterase